MAHHFTHATPVWRDKSNYVVQILLDGELGDEPEYEQLWTQLQADGSHLLCCIPFFLYGISLGDRFLKLEDGRFQLLVPAGRSVLRIWMADVGKEEQVNIVEYVESLGCLVERSSLNLVAVDCSSSELLAKLRIYLDGLAVQGKIQYELGSSS